MAEKQFHGIIMFLKMFIELRNHQPHQFSQVLQVFIDVVVSWSAHKYSSLHETNEAPECLRFVFYFTQNRRQEIAHALSVTK